MWIPTRGKLYRRQRTNERNPVWTWLGHVIWNSEGVWPWNMSLCRKLYSDAWNHSVIWAIKYLYAGKDCIPCGPLSIWRVWVLIIDLLSFSLWGSGEKSAVACVWSAARGLRERTSSKDLWVGTESGNSPSDTPAADKKDWIRRYWYKNVLLGCPAWHFPKREMHQI